MDNPRKSIFLVDDDITNLTIGKKALMGTYNVFTLNSGQTALNMLENLTPDIILLDVNMPDMDGYQVISKLKSNEATADIPVVFLTALSNEEEELKGFSLGAIDYITKPFSTPLLLKRLEVHLLVESQKKELLKFNTQLTKLVADKTRTVEDLKNAILSTMAELVEYRDAITGGHIIRTQRYLRILLNAMHDANVYTSEISEYDEDLIIQSCQLHDIGKISVTDAILNKPARLTEDEFELMKSHALSGEKVILRLKEKAKDSEFLEYARIFAVAHHEKWDGSGYPHGLAQTNIPLLGRMMAIADVYDALVEARPYKPAFPHEKAVNIMLEGRGAQFDPQLIDVFSKIHEEFERISKEVSDA